MTGRAMCYMIIHITRASDVIEHINVLKFFLIPIFSSLV
jgi:hypothetical protein